MLDNLNNFELEKLQAILEAERISSITELKETVENIFTTIVYHILLELQ